MFFSRQIGLSDAGGGDSDPRRLTGDGACGAYALGALNIQQRAQRAWCRPPTSPPRALQRAILANSDVGLDPAEQGCEGGRATTGSPASTQTSVSAAEPGGLRRQDDRAPKSTVAGQRRGRSTRANFNYQSRGWLARGAYEAIGRPLSRRTRLRASDGRESHRRPTRGRNLRPAWASRIGIREIGPHLSLRPVRPRATAAAPSRATSTGTSC